MVYYILLEGESKELLMYDGAILGETTDDGKKFYPNRGFNRLLALGKISDEFLSRVEIYDDNRKKLSVEQFLNKIKDCKMMTL